MDDQIRFDALWTTSGKTDDDEDCGVFGWLELVDMNSMQLIVVTLYFFVFEMNSVYIRMKRDRNVIAFSDISPSGSVLTQAQTQRNPLKQTAHF